MSAHNIQTYKGSKKSIFLYNLLYVHFIYKFEWLLYIHLNDIRTVFDINQIADDNRIILLKYP